MAVGYNPATPSDGLVFNVNTANPRSYSGGTVWRDLSRYRNDGTLTNGPTLNTGIGGGITFDGLDDVITVDNPSEKLRLAKPTGVPWTASAWIKISSGPASICGTWTSTTYSGWHFGIRGTHQVQFGTLVVNGTGGNYARGSALINTNQWTHVVAMFFGQSTYPIGRVFVNGVEDTIVNIAGGHIADLTSPIFAVGNLPPPYGFANQTNGQLQDIRVYDRLLSDIEVIQIFNATRRRFGI